MPDKNQNSFDEINEISITVNDAKLWSITSFVFSGLGILFTFWALTALANEIDSESSIGPIGFSLALLQTILALGALGGFWMIRAAAMEKAADAARETTREYLNRHFDDGGDGTVLIRRLVESWRNANDDRPDGQDEEDTMSMFAQGLGDEDE